MALIKCSECGSDISENAVSCPKCGNPIKQVGAAIARAPKKPFRWHVVLGSVLLGLLIIFASLYIIGKVTKNQAWNLSSEHSLEIVHGSLVVQSVSYRYYEFDINPTASNHRITGRFSASGGSGDDIRVLVMTKDDFTNFRNGHKAKGFYDSGQTTVANLDVSLPSTDQKYVLVFDNTFSVFTNKEVNADINYICTY